LFVQLVCLVSCQNEHRHVITVTRRCAPWIRNDGLSINSSVASGGARCPLLLYHEELQFFQESWNRARSTDTAVWKLRIVRQTTDHHGQFDRQDLSTGSQSEIRRFLRISYADNNAARFGSDQDRHHEEQFSDHRPLVNRKVDPMLGGMLFMLNGDQWKNHRNMLSPTFTSSKIKTMFKLMSECASRFAEHLSNLSKEQREMDMKVLLTKYTNDVIASCVYNASVDSIKEPNNVFYVYGRICTSMATFKRSMMFLVHRNVPWLAELLQLKFVDKTVETRQRTGDRRSDILQLFMDNNKKREPGREMSVQDMANHAFSFFFGGFDTVSSQTCIVAHLLTENPDVQERVQQEIDETLEKNNGELTYDAMHDMKYLDAVISETLRLYPIASFIDRMCVKDFELPPARSGDKPFTVKG
ncbi:unnamed protein product, partial [Heterotrigona itama]